MASIGSRRSDIRIIFRSTRLILDTIETCLENISLPEWFMLLFDLRTAKNVCVFWNMSDFSFCFRGDSRSHGDTEFLNHSAPYSQGAPDSLPLRYCYLIHSISGISWRGTIIVIP